MPSSTENLISAINNLNSSSFTDDNERVLVLRAAQALCSRLETPYETIMRLTYQEPPYRFALQMADKLSLFHHLDAASPSSRSTDELASLSSAEPDLVRRILRHLAAKHTLVQPALDRWAPTPLSRAFAGPAGGANIRALAQRAETVFGAGPAFFDAHGLRSPTDGRDTIHQRAYGCPGVGMFERLKRPENADQWRDFNLAIAWNTRYRTSWMDVCPPGPLFGDHGLEDPREVALVDIGGGTGADVAEVRRRYPVERLPARVVLQELPHVVESARRGNEDGELKGSLDGVELQVHDFWTPQPVLGARIYYMSSVLHDWPDEKSKVILGHVVRAMRKGYSRLILNENVVPEMGCLPQLSGMDLTMMANLAAKERTETDWRELLRSQGLRLVKVHTVPSCTKAVIEAELED